MYKSHTGLILASKLTALRQRGVTLIELVIVVVILGIITAGMTSLLVQGFRSYTLGKNITNVEWQGRIALETMVRDLRSVRSASDISVAASGQITFVDVDGDAFNYYLNGTQLQRDVSSQANNEVVADGVQSLTFAYYDSNGNVLGGSPLVSPLNAAQRALIHYITVTLIITINSVTFTKTATVYLWNT